MRLLSAGLLGMLLMYALQGLGYKLRLLFRSGNGVEPVPVPRYGEGMKAAGCSVGRSDSMGCTGTPRAAGVWRQPYRDRLPPAALASHLRTPFRSTDQGWQACHQQHVEQIQRADEAEEVRPPALLKTGSRSFPFRPCRCPPTACISARAPAPLQGYGLMFFGDSITEEWESLSLCTSCAGQPRCDGARGPERAAAAQAMAGAKPCALSRCCSHASPVPRCPLRLAPMCCRRGSRLPPPLGPVPSRRDGHCWRPGAAGAIARPALLSTPASRDHASVLPLQPGCGQSAFPSANPQFSTAAWHDLPPFRWRTSCGGCATARCRRSTSPRWAAPHASGGQGQGRGGVAAVRAPSASRQPCR